MTTQQIARRRIAAAVAGLAAASVASGVLVSTLAADGATSARGPVDPDPADFANPQHNAYFPLTPGLVTRLRGSDEGEKFRQAVRVTGRTKTIQGIECTVVRDVVRRTDGTIAEKTHDWYAADNDGNVWYFGEATATYDDEGHLEDREGSWQAGVDGAVAGMIMTADPEPTDAFRQEYWKGEAEDQAWIVQNNTRKTVPARSFRHVVRSLEWSRLEKNVVAVKFYARGIGIIAEKDLAGGNERFELVSVDQP